MGVAIAAILLGCFYATGEDVYAQYAAQMQTQAQAPAARGGFFGIPLWAGLGGGYVAASFLPNIFLAGKKKKDQKRMESLQYLLQTTNKEKNKLQTMIWDYEIQNKELRQALVESEKDALQRDYDEFKQPDANGDDVISEMEFSQYITNYMKAYPHIPREEYPTFRDFDTNRDGLVTFQEWQDYLYQQQLAEKQQAKYDTKSKSYNVAQNMYDQANSAQGFQNLYDELNKLGYAATQRSYGR